MRVFLVGMANFATGGTELLHQFSECLRDMGVESYMIYPDSDGVNCPTPETFLKYGVRYVSSYVDSDDAILVLTETQVHLAKDCVKGTVMLWWLSVDNYLIAYKEKMQGKDIDIFDLKSKKNIVHFVQSFYAKKFLEEQLGIESSYFLGDYINDEIVQTAALHYNDGERKNICLYNPRKGFEELGPIIESCRKDIIWIPLVGYKPKEMTALMCTAKLYVDFGGHPGKDRIPREAALCGCCILTNKKGSAAFREDVGIPERYKVDDTRNIAATQEKIYDLIDHYDERKNDFLEYRNVITNEKKEFMEDLKSAIAIMKESASINNRNSIADVVKHEKMLDSINIAVEQLNQLVVKAKADCLEGNSSEVANKLLTVDYVLQVIRESIYAELVDLSEIS